MIFNNAVSYVPYLIWGKVLQLGLGEGTLSNYLLKFKGISELTTLEIDEDIISQYENTDSRHKIVQGDGVEYYDKHQGEYDFIVQDLPGNDFNDKWLKTPLGVQLWDNKSLVTSREKH